MIIEVDIVTLKVRVNGRAVGTTTTEKMHKARYYARKYCNPKENSTYYTNLGGKIASQHDIPDDVAERIMEYLLGDLIKAVEEENV